MRSMRCVSVRAALTRLVLSFVLLCCVPRFAFAKPAAVGKLQVTPASLKFTSPGNQSVTIKNVGGAALSGNVGTPSSSAFNVSSGGGAFDLAPDATATVTVTFTGAPPKGKASGKLAITAGKTSKNVSLSGTGLESSGTVILFGGVPNTANIIGNTDVFNSTGLSFSAAPEMNDSRGFEHYAPYLDPAVVTGGAAGMVFVSGGQDNSDSILNTTLLYDPTSNSFADGPPLNTARAEHSVTLFTTGSLLGQVLIVGGLQLDEFGNRIALNDQELYNPAAGSIGDLGADMTDARGQHTATLLNDGRILVAGGYDENFDRNGFNEATATAELFNPGSESFSCVTVGASTGTSTSACPDVMSSSRWNHRATLLTDGTVLVTGGTPTDSGTKEGTASADLFNPATDAFSALPDMISARQGHSSTLIQGCNCAADGMVLLAGGQNQTGAVINTAELYDPSTKTFTAVGNMTSHRAEHQAVGFTTGGLAGYVLIMGGYPSPNEKGVNTAELFDPNTRKFIKIGSMTVDRYEFPATVIP
jgi:Galactose oxidase, central domain